MPEHEDAICPGCGTVLTDSREPGDQDYCVSADRSVILAPANKNPDSHPVRGNDGPQPFCPDYMCTRGAILRRRDGNRVPVEMVPSHRGIEP